MMKQAALFAVGLLSLSCRDSQAFAPKQLHHARLAAFFASDRSPTSLEMNFFKDVFKDAFQNDASLDGDRTKGQYDGPNDDYDDSISIARSTATLTDTQQKWRQQQQSPVPQLMANSQWTLDLFLTGVPERDPSNDLFASKTNISSRDRTVGLAMPEQPTVSNVGITLLENGVCQVESDSDFLARDETTGKCLEGEWKLSDDGQQLRFSLNVLGYQRTVTTKGSIQKIYWSKEDDVTTQTSTAYSIPAGFVYGDAQVEQGRRVGTIEIKDGVIRVEKATGLLGAGTKLVPCGRFTARPANAEQGKTMVQGSV